MINLNNLKTLYLNSPLWVKKLYASIPYDIRNGREYRKWKLFLDQQLNQEEYQLLKLKETILYAYNNTTYYQKMFDELNCHPFDINTTADLNNIPTIDKNIVRQHYHDLKVKHYPKRKSFFVMTGGSTGEPMKFLQSKNVWSKEVAFINQYFESLGYSSKLKKASFRGGDFGEIVNNKFWKENPINNEIHFSPFHLNSENVHHYVNELNRVQIKYFHAYPSGILTFIDNMINNNLRLDYQVEAIFLISENFTQVDIEYIKKYFNCNVSSFFGHSERLIFAPLDMETSNSYKINPYYGFTELVNESNNSIIKNNVEGELVGTGFDNYSMPLIRYRTGDHTSYQDYKKLSLNLIKGRWDNECLFGKNGLKITFTALNTHSDVFKNCINFQFYQEEIGKVELLIVPKKEFDDTDKQRILDALNKKIGDSIEFTLKIVPSLILTKRGKMKKCIIKI